MIVLSFSSASYSCCFCRYASYISSIQASFSLASFLCSFPSGPLNHFLQKSFSPGYFFVHQHGADQHIRIDDLVGIIMKPDTVHGFQHPAVLIAHSLCRPYFPPVSCGVLAGLIQAHQASKRAVAIRKAGRGDVECFPADTVGIWPRSFRRIRRFPHHRRCI